jgi:hypothetical protein
MRDHIHPPLNGLDAVDVLLDDTHIALVVIVPQARGLACQTDDLFFPRRDAQGLHHMTVQEIEDVRARQVRPVLELEARDLQVGTSSSSSGQAWTTRIQFVVTNVAQAIADLRSSLPALAVA